MVLIASLIGIVAGVFLLTALVGAPYVPTHRSQARAAFTVLRPLASHDAVLDIGSGDGVVLQEALRAGAGKVIGYEINPLLVAVAWLRCARRGNCIVQWRNFWHTDIPRDVTVVYTFGESRDIAQMYDYVVTQAYQQGRIIELVSYGFAVPGVAYQRQHNAHYLYKISPLQLIKT